VVSLPTADLSQLRLIPLIKPFVLIRVHSWKNPFYP